ncbi:MAG TPA: GNAT family N-acetyltransferase, partial [Acidimicrobiales bacterium]|nr:GNAT family N-acetyltransferase [Acidimicrobiales bacterium]
ATLDGAVVGHALLRPRSAPPSVELAATELGVDRASLGFVARLLVDPARRRLGIGRLLLDTVVADARARGLTPVLDVVVRDGGAIALYEATGWTRLGGVTMAMRDGGEHDLVVFAKP